MKFSLQALYHWYQETLRHPKYRWWIVLGTFAYLLSPFDIAPDFFPILGEIDDVALVTLMVAELSKILIERVKQQRSPEPQPPMSAEEASYTVEVDAVQVPD